MVHRGIGLSEKEWNDEWFDNFEPGSKYTSPSKDSFTKDRSRAAYYGSGQIKVILTVISKNGVDVSTYSRFPAEQEVILPKGYTILIKSREFKEGGIIEILSSEI